ncbi:uncharacterized protein LOC110447326 isoform X2 [Mizuhopecten yessoensis]|uniref:uncharacterized protein LOC110447326 isoform X2 n=1 Tax=Mizuhopecten yessoensis TaxID=6573 RepID=UPI000B45BB7D|nr:uncharacterized protein LOC110447326 isoform X2 [Mizuhopecten yessoensis]
MAAFSPDAIGGSVLEGLVVQDHGDEQFEFELKIDNSADFDMESQHDESGVVDAQDIPMLSEGENKLLSSMAEIQADGVSDTGGLDESQGNYSMSENVANEEGIELQLTSDLDIIKIDTEEMPPVQDFSNLDIIPQDKDITNMVSRPDVVPDTEAVTAVSEDVMCEPLSTEEIHVPKLKLDNLDAIRENEMLSVDSIEIDEKPVDEAESISLVDLMKQQRDEDDSSGSEFDFDLPPSAKASSSDTKDKPPSPNKMSKAQAPPPPTVATALPPSTILTPPFTSTTTAPVVHDTPSDPGQGSEVKTKVDDGNKEHFTSGSYPVSFKQASLTSNITMIAKPPLEEHVSVEPRDDIQEEKHNEADPSQQMGHFAHSHAQNEWDNVQTIEAGFTDPNLTKGPGGVKMTPLMSYTELEETLRPMDYSSAMQNIRQTVNRRGFSALKHILFGPPKLNRNLLKEKEFVFCVAATPLNNNTIVHTRALQTIYRCLTGSRFDCGRFGPHWEEIGFQGNDPSTDLRGTGVLGLLNLVHLLRNPKRQSFARDIYKLALHPTQNFPFCVMGINMSRIVLQALREDCLNKECNKRQEVLGVVNDLYTALYLELYQTWKSQGKTITDSGYVIKTLESKAKKNPQRLIKDMEEYINRKKSSMNLDNMDVGGENFLSVCDTEAGQY